jgi:hypothetical protein
MNPIVKNILVVIAGLVIGSVVNMGLIMIGGSVIPPPEGVDVSNMESLKAAMPLFETKHFIFPFLAHALGTLAGAWIVARLATTHKTKLAWLIGGFFLLGGIINVVSLSAPVWFNILDLTLAYIPMAWLGGKWGMGKAD